MGLQGGYFQTEIFEQKIWLGGDIVLEILGNKCDTPHSLGSVTEEIKNLKPGDSINLKILRRVKYWN